MQLLWSDNTKKSKKAATMKLLVLLTAVGSTLAQFNNSPDVDIWCGKAYRASNASFNPGGQFLEPSQSLVPLLNLKVAPRMSLYLSDEQSGSFLINASISHLVGVPYHSAPLSYDGTTDRHLTLQLLLNGTGCLLAHPAVVELNKVTEVAFNLSAVPARLEPYDITAIVTDKHGAIYRTTSQFSRLPLRSDNGTATRIDNIHGGLAYRKASDVSWKPVFPYTYYVQWSLYWHANLSTLDEFASMGYNVIHIVPTGDLGNTLFPWTEFEPYIHRADELGLLLQYDVRWDYSNLTTMIDQVERLKSHSSILLWYTGDEPDGKSNPINSTRIAYDTIRAIDPYRPVSLALNCYDFYYSDYASGAEIILSDVYPISTNTSYSTVYETPCNATYGCCGCDDCKGSFEDISDRLDKFARFDDIIGWQKTHWGAPQAFGNETFWTRYPTAAEEVVMNMLSINHGAKGIVMWDFPTTADILNVTNRLANVLTSELVSTFLISEQGINVGVPGNRRIDATAWISDETVLLSVINLNYSNLNGTVTIALPGDVKVTSITNMLWGEASWTAEGGKITTAHLMGLESSLLLLRRAQRSHTDGEDGSRQLKHIPRYR